MSDYRDELGAAHARIAELEAELVAAKEANDDDPVLVAEVERWKRAANPLHRTSGRGSVLAAGFILAWLGFAFAMAGAGQSGQAVKDGVGASFVGVVLFVTWWRKLATARVNLAVAERKLEQSRRLRREERLARLEPEARVRVEAEVSEDEGSTVEEGARGGGQAG